MFEAMGGRKLVFGILITVAGIALAVQGKLTGETTAFLLCMYATFAGANALTTIKTMVTPSPQSESATTEEKPVTEPTIHPQVEQALIAVMQRQQASEANLATLQESLAGVQKAMVAALSPRQ
jgi:hypothetical protein